MRIALCADVHLGNHRRFGGQLVSSLNERCRLSLDTFKRALQMAEEMSCNWLVVCGDLFHTAKPEPQLLHKVMGLVQYHTPEVAFLVGNHELVSTADGDNALAPLRYTGRVIEPASPTASLVQGLDVIWVPYSGPNALDAVQRAVDEAPPKKPGLRILCIHYGVKDDKTPAWLGGSSDGLTAQELADMCHMVDARYCFAGHWHNCSVNRFFYGEDEKAVDVVQLGSLCPTGFDNPGLEGYGGLAILDTDPHSTSPVRLFEIPGPRFLKLDRQEPMDAADFMDHMTYVSVTCEQELLADISKGLRKMVKDGVLLGAEAVTDLAEAEAQARQSARLARKAETLGEAISAFVSKMALDEGVDRAAVLDRVREYLEV